MVFGNVPKLHGLIALFAGVLAIPAGCSGDDFSGCKASRTCKPSSGGASGTGGNDGGAGSDTGGSSGSSSSGKGGTSGTDDGGAGTGGTGDDTDPPTIVSFSPGDGDVDVERDIEVTATFSEPIDERSVTTTNVVLTGPDGDVAGTLSVDGEVVSFVPERPLYLLGDYTLTIGDAVADLAGNTLGEEASVAFKVRDGRWSEPTYPFGRTARYMGGFARNAEGDLVIGGGQPMEPATAFWAAIYRAKERMWTPVATLTVPEPARSGENYRGMGIDADGHAAFVWQGSTAGGWFRFSEERAWEDAGELPATSVVAVTSEGRATAVWAKDYMLSSRTQNIAAGTIGPIVPIRAEPVRATDPQAVASLDRFAYFGLTPGGSGDEISVTWQHPTSGWETPEPVASANDIAGWYVEGDSDGNILLLWVQGTQIWSRVYEREGNDWTRSEFVASASIRANVGYPQMLSGNAAVTLWLDGKPYGAFYRRGVGWVQDSIIELDRLGAEDFTAGYFGIATALEARGNVLAVGRTGYQRYSVEQGWQQPREHGLDLGPWRLWMAVAADGSAVGITHDLTSTNETIPKVVHFE